jgi:hypothetical protein
MLLCPHSYHRSVEGGKAARAGAECSRRLKRPPDTITQSRIGVRMLSLRIVSATAALATSFIATVGVSAPMAQTRHPTGTYCGQLLSAGVMAEVETRFVQNIKSGVTTGNYVFSEQGQPVEGLLADAGDDGDSSDLTRIFIWRDKYGYGKLVVTFAPDFSGFEGKWSLGGQALAPWNGKRCSNVTS